MQTKATVRYYLTLTRMAVIGNDIVRSVDKDVEHVELLCAAARSVIVDCFGKHSGRSLKTEAYGYRMT